MAYVVHEKSSVSKQKSHKQEYLLLSQDLYWVEMRGKQNFRYGFKAIVKAAAGWILISKVFVSVTTVKIQASNEVDYKSGGTLNWILSQRSLDFSERARIKIIPSNQFPRNVQKNCKLDFFKPSHKKS